MEYMLPNWDWLEHWYRPEDRRLVNSSVARRLLPDRVTYPLVIIKFAAGASSAQKLFMASTITKLMPAGSLIAPSVTKLRNCELSWLARESRKPPDVACKTLSRLLPVAMLVTSVALLSWSCDMAILFRSASSLPLISLRSEKTPEGEGGNLNALMRFIMVLQRFLFAAFLVVT